MQCATKRLVVLLGFCPLVAVITNLTKKNFLGHVVFYNSFFLATREKQTLSSHPPQTCHPALVSWLLYCRPKKWEWIGKE
jgi:hypothetical protein